MNSSGRMKQKRVRKKERKKERKRERERDQKRSVMKQPKRMLICISSSNKSDSKKNKDETDRQTEHHLPVLKNFSTPFLRFPGALLNCHCIINNILKDV